MRIPATLSLALILTVIHVGFAAEQAQQNQPQQRRFTFEQFSSRHDANQDGKVEQDEFKGAPQWFRWLDQNGDGTVTAEEFQERTQRDGRWQPSGERTLPDGVNALRDLYYANVDGQSLKLDLYVPEKSDTKPLLLVWIHGGGWTRGSKSQFNPIFVRRTGEGYACASIDYRLDGLRQADGNNIPVAGLARVRTTGVWRLPLRLEGTTKPSACLTSHPKQIHDCKGPSGGCVPMLRNTDMT